MTDRNPDDLYDALRDRLADYGQEPPAPLWANIRAQLPPPVAMPQLRRRRRWSPVLLLGLLVAVVGSSYWLWRHSATTRPFAHRSPATQWPAARPGQSDTPAPNATDRSAPASTKSTAALRNAHPAPASSAPAGTQTAANSPGGASATSTDQYAANANQPAAADGPASQAATNNGRVKYGQSAQTKFHNQPVGVVAGRPGTRAGKPAFGTVATANETDVARSAHSTSAERIKHTALALQTDINNRRRPRATQAAVLPTAAASRPATAGTLATATRPGVQPAASSARDESSGTTKAAGLLAAQPTVDLAPAPAAADFAASTASLTAARLAIGRVEAPAVAVQLPAFAGPLVRSQPDSAYLHKLLSRHWALLVLAGPALTHRRLGSSNTDLNSTSPPFVLSPTADSSSRTSASQLAQQERQSTGFGVQVQVSKVLNGRWALSAGLGYQEFASYAKAVSVVANRFVPPTSSTATHRDTYRFLTVPVQASYALGQAGGRWQYGLLAGGEAAIYLGGSTLKPNGDINHWDTGNSPYRALSLALSAGLDVRYRLSPRLEAVAQPSATYFLNALARPTAGTSPRYLWGGSALLGVSYHLR